MPIRGLGLSRVPVWQCWFCMVWPDLSWSYIYFMATCYSWQEGDVQDLGGESEVAAVIACSWGWLQWEAEADVLVGPSLFLFFCFASRFFCPVCPPGLQEPQVPHQIQGSSIPWPSSPAPICVPLFQLDVIFPRFSCKFWVSAHTSPHTVGRAQQWVFSAPLPPQSGLSFLISSHCCVSSHSVNY